jgi:aminomethyltransferase
LHDRHEALGAKWADFGGWSMPLEYAGGGVTREHESVRSGVGVFDVSHLGTAVVSGSGAASAVNAVLTNDLDRITDGEAQYSLLCNDTGGVVDDLIVYRVGGDEILLIPNASNSATVLQILRDALPGEVAITDLHTERAIIAVQGPRSAEVLALLGLTHDMDYMAFANDVFEGRSVTVCRTGYTGELGFELVIDAAAASSLWDAVLAAPLGSPIVPCGLAARDTLRTEMGYPLHGQDLSPSISPVQAGVSWAIGWDKPSFHGRDALVAERAAGPSRRLRGLAAQGRGIPRAHMSVSGADGTVVGEVTSGTFSPTLQHGIALALLDAGVAIDDEVLVDVRGRAVPFVVVKPPFVEASPR